MSQRKAPSSQFHPLKQTMDFLSDYWTYHQCYEIPRNYALWAGISALASTVHRKVVYLHGDLEFHGNMYVGLIGPQGGGKTTCCDFSCKMFIESNPDANIGPSRASPESIVKDMSSEKFDRVFTNHLGEQIVIRPYFFFINEFKNFVGRSPFDMITFLTDIYDRKAYKAGTIIRGMEDIINPCINLLVCETPEWIIENMKGSLISGGFSRRIIYVFETVDPEPKPFINLTPTAVAAKQRVIQRMIDMRTVTGEYKWAPNSEQTYQKWYLDNYKRYTNETNGVMRGYLKSKNTQLYKVMMLLDASSDKPMLLFTPDLIEHGLALLNSIEANMPKLSLASGRSEVIGGQQKVLEVLEHNEGWLPEKELKKITEGSFKNPTEQWSCFRQLEDTGQIEKKLYKIPNSQGVGVERWMILLPWKYEQQRKDGEVKITTRPPTRSPLESPLT